MSTTLKELSLLVQSLTPESVVENVDEIQKIFARLEKLKVKVLDSTQIFETTFSQIENKFVKAYGFVPSKVLALKKTCRLVSSQFDCDYICNGILRVDTSSDIDNDVDTLIHVCKQYMSHLNYQIKVSPEKTVSRNICKALEEVERLPLHEDPPESKNDFLEVA